MATIVGYTYTQYSGIWTMQQVDSAIAAGTWPSQPAGLFSWGQNTSGELGLGNTTNYSSPKQVSTTATWSAIDGSSHAVAIKTGNTLWVWGKNNYGQLGLGNTSARSSPVQVGLLTNWLNASASFYDTLAVKTDGTLWGWGQNEYGCLGLGNTSYYSSPKQIGALTNWSTVCSSYGWSAALKTDGTLWTWGYNLDGRLGLNNRTNYSSPKQVGLLTTWSQISIGTGGTCIMALKTDGTLWAWGGGTSGALGLGNTTSYSSPKQVGALTNWGTVSAGFGNSTLAIKTDGTLWTWGQNNVGQLGLGNITNYSSPKQIGALTTWLKVSAGFYTSAAIKTDGTLWTWGWNNVGNLGQGNTTNLSSPTQVGSQSYWTSVTAADYGMYAIV